MPRMLTDFPEEGDLVVGTVQNVKNYGAFITLDEFDNKEGFIHIAEVAPGWIKYIRDHIREGQKVVCRVLRIEEAKGHIDLSLKQVNEHQRRERIQEWKNEQKADKLFELVAEKAKIEEDEAYEEFGYDLIEKFGGMYRAFEECAIDEEALANEDFKGKWTKHFIQVASENISPPFVNVTGFLELTCPASDGIRHISAALIKAEEMDSERFTVQYIGAPKYRIKVRASDYKTAEEDLKNATDAAIDYIKDNGGQGKFSRK